MTNGTPPILPYDGPRRPKKATRWPWFVIGAIALASCVAYGCFLAGLVSFDSLVSGIIGAAYVVVPVVAIIAGIKYGTQEKDYWM